MLKKNLFPHSLTHFHRDLFLLFVRDCYAHARAARSHTGMCTKLTSLCGNVIIRETMIRVKMKILSAIKSRSPGQWSGGQTKSRPKPNTQTPIAFVPNMHSIWQHIKHGASYWNNIFNARWWTRPKRSRFDNAQVVTDTANCLLRQKNHKFGEQDTSGLF